jgi:hypothetical protein
MATPGPIGMSAHAALGELLIATDKPGEALAQIEAPLRLSKNRVRGYYRTAKAANAVGNADRFKVHIAKLAEVCGQPGAVPARIDAKDTQLQGLPCAWLAHP